MKGLDALNNLKPDLEHKTEGKNTLVRVYVCVYYTLRFATIRLRATKRKLDIG